MKQKISLVLVLLCCLNVLPLSAQTDARCSALAEEDCTILVNALDTFKTLGAFNNAAFSVEIGGGGATSTGNAASVRGSGPMLIDDTGLVTALDFSVTDANGQSAELLWVEDRLFIQQQVEDGTVTWQGADLESETAQLLVNLLSGNLFTQALQEANVSVTQRLEDGTQNGQTMQVFQSDIDLISLLLTPDILDLLEDLLAAVPQDTGGDLGNFEDLAGAIPLLGMLLEKDTVQSVFWVGEDDGLIHHVEFVMDILLDASAFDPNQEPISFFVKVVSDLDGHGETFTLEAPTEFTPLDLQEFDLTGLLGTTLADTTEPSVSDEQRYAVEFSISYGDTVSGTLSSANTEDVWGLSASAGDVITITLKAANPESILDTRLYLRGLNGEEILLNDDHSTDRADLTLFDSVIENYAIPADGEYRLVATWLAEVTDGAYELTVEAVE